MKGIGNKPLLYKFFKLSLRIRLDDAMFATMIAESQDKFATAEHIGRVIRNVHKLKPQKERNHGSLKVPKILRLGGS